MPNNKSATHRPLALITSSCTMRESQRIEVDHMKLGINVRNWGPTATPECIAACARYADQSSLDSIWVNDHIGLPPEFEHNPYGISPDMAHILDPLGVACFLAAITSRIKIGRAHV